MADDYCIENELPGLLATVGSPAGLLLIRLFLIIRLVALTTPDAVLLCILLPMDYYKLCLELVVEMLE